MELDGDYIYFNFAGQTLDHYILRGDFTGADFTGASLVGADLRRGTFNDANFTEADLQGAKLPGDFWRQVANSGG